MARGETVQVQEMLDSHGNPLTRATATKLPRVAFTEDAGMNALQPHPAQSRAIAAVMDAPAAGNQERPKAYSHIKLSLANQLRLLRDVLKKRGNERRDHQCQESMVKLADDRSTRGQLSLGSLLLSSLDKAAISFSV